MISNSEIVAYYSIEKELRASRCTFKLSPQHLPLSFIYIYIYISHPTSKYLFRERESDLTSLSLVVSCNRLLFFIKKATAIG